MKSAHPSADSASATDRDAPPGTVSASVVSDGQWRSLAGSLPPALAPLAEAPFWVIWRLETRANGKPTKKPYRPAQTGRLARTNDPRTWGTLRDAQAAAELGQADGIGLVLLQAQGYAALDLDKCRHPDTGELDAWAQEILDRCPGAYVEVTPSGAGLRVIGRAELDTGFQSVLRVDGSVAGAQVEIYHLAARYITVTGQQLAGPASPEELGDISDVVLDLAVQAAEQKPATGDAPIAANPDALGEIEDIVAALVAIPNEDLSWDEWSRIGMAAWRASGGSPDGFDAWVLWSEKSPKHDLGACEERWDHWSTSSPPDRIGMGTLVHEARFHQPNWTHPSRRVDAREAFNDAGDAAGLAAMEAAGEKQAGERDVLREVAEKVVWHPARERFIRVDSGVMLTKEGFNTSSDLGLRLLPLVPTNKGGRPIVKPADFAIEAGVREVLGVLHLPGRPRVAHYKWSSVSGRVKGLWFNSWTPMPTWHGPVPTEDDHRVKWFFDFTARLMPDRNEAGMALDWAAHLVQYPHIKIRWALGLVGGQGNGKDSWLECIFREGVGQQNIAVVKGSKLRADQTETPWVEKHVVLVSEVPSFHKHDLYEFVKEMISGDSGAGQIVRKLYNDTTRMPDYACWAFTSNHSDAFALPDADERRFFLPACKGPPLTADEVEALRANMTEENLRAVAAVLRARPIGTVVWDELGKFSPHRCPGPTALKREMAEAGRHPVQRWVEEWLAKPAQAGRTVIAVTEAEEAFENAQRSGFGSIKAAWNAQKAGAGFKGAGWSNDGDSQVRLVPPSMGVNAKLRVWWRTSAWEREAVSGASLREALFAEASDIRERAEEIEREFRRSRIGLAGSPGGEC